MKKILLAAIVLFMIVPVQDVEADITCVTGTNANPVPYTNETLTVSNTSLGLTATKYNGTDGGGQAVEADICFEGAVRVWFDGTAPTASVGIPVVGSATAPQCIVTCGPTIAKFRAIRQSVDVTASVQYSR